MARPRSKADLLSVGQANFEKLNEFIASLSPEELTTRFDFSSDDKKKEAHWQRDKNLRDVLVHLYEWHQLLLQWVSANENGNRKPFLPAPYNWRTYGVMNLEFWKKGQETSLVDANESLQKSHQAIMQLAEIFSNDALFTKNAFPWVGGATLGSYFVSATASHYDWAIKKLKAHRKNCNRVG